MSLFYLQDSHFFFFFTTSDQQNKTQKSRVNYHKVTDIYFLVIEFNNILDRSKFRYFIRGAKKFYGNSYQFLEGTLVCVASMRRTQVPAA